MGQRGAADRIHAPALEGTANTLDRRGVREHQGIPAHLVDEALHLVGRTHPVKPQVREGMALDRLGPPALEDIANPQRGGDEHRH